MVRRWGGTSPRSHACLRRTSSDAADAVEALRGGCLARVRLAGVAETGDLDREHVDVFAHILLAAMNEVAMLIARSERPADALPTAERAVNEFLRRLLGH
jgi:hypothetical protein